MHGNIARRLCPYHRLLNESARGPPLPVRVHNIHHDPSLHAVYTFDSGRETRREEHYPLALVHSFIWEREWGARAWVRKDSKGVSCKGSARRQRRRRFCQGRYWCYGCAEPNVNNQRTGMVGSDAADGALRDI